MTPAIASVRRHADFWVGLASAFTALLIALIALRGWQIDLSVPLRLGGDATQTLGYVQNILESGSPTSGPRLNAPFGQQFLGFPLGADLLNFALLRIIGFATNDAAATVTLFLLLTFPLVAVTTYASLRGLGVARPIAYFAAVVYAIVPFHFMRGMNHLFLAAYYAVPLACFLVVRTASGRAFFGIDRPPPAGRLKRLGAVAGPTFIAAIVATTGIYYAAFTLMLLIPAAIFGWLRTRSRGILASAFLIGSVILAVLAVTAIPNFLFALENGPNADFPARGIAETGKHQLRLLSLFMPVAGHYFPPFAALAARYATEFPPTGENGESAGLIIALGLLLLGVVAIGSLVGAFSRRRLWRQERTIAAVVLVCLVIALSGGASGLFAFLVTPQIRGWARLSIFIEFLGLLALALALTLAWRYLRRTRWRNVVIVALLLGVGFAAVDQTGRNIVPTYEANRTRSLAEAAFTRAVEDSLPPGAAVYQLPYRPYPEAGPVGVVRDYEQLTPYLQSDSLRFSYGGEKGREAGWQHYIFNRDGEEILPILCTGGFSAIWLDRESYGLDQGRAVESGLASALGAPPIVDQLDRHAVFDLGPFCERFVAGLDDAELEVLHDHLMRPVRMSWARGARPARLEQGMIVRGVQLPAKLSLLNEGDNGRPVTVSFRVDAAPPDGLINIVWPDGSSQQVAVGSHVEKTIDLAAGWNSIEFADGGGSQRIGDFQMSDFYAMDPDLLALRAN